MLKEGFMKKEGIGRKSMCGNEGEAKGGYGRKEMRKHGMGNCGRK